MSEEAPPAVVIIDPSRLTRVIIDVCLRRQGVRSLGFADGASALQALSANPDWIPQAIVLELAFSQPGFDGYTLIRALRVNPRLDGAGIIVLASRLGLAGRVRARLAGANALLAKPFIQKRFLAAVLPYLTPRKPGQSLVRDYETPEHAARGEHQHEINSMRAGPSTRQRHAS